jgi:hypothetical protein
MVLRAYFDDSGTHDGSKAVVWAGVVGPEAAFDQLDSAWAAKLARPLPGKPRLNKFSVGDCAVSVGEFASYKPAERDALRYDMRQIIRDAGVHCRAFTVPIEIYNRIIKGRVRRAYGPPHGIAFAACADYSLSLAETNNQPLVCIFDKGQKQPLLDFLVADAEKRAASRGVPISYGFAAVKDVCGLQAADTIATEHYWYSLDALNSPRPKMTPHMQSLVKMTDPAAYVLMEAEMEKFKAEYLAKYPLKNWLGSVAARFRGR